MATGYAIKWLKDKLGTKFFPVTHIKAVRNDNNVNLETLLGQKQDELVSGTNIKTINNNSLVGSGNITISSPTKTSDLTNDSGFITSADIPEGSAASTTSPLMDGTASVGTEMAFARGDHVHPSDTSKQDVISDLATIRSGATAGASAYQKPSGGIPKTDLATTIQTSLGKADTALQSFTETDPVFSASAAAGISSTDITNWNNKSTFSGSYNDLTNKPTIPSAPGTLKTNATTAQTASASEALSGTITLHKISKTGTYSDLIGKPTIPTKVSDLTNDSNFTSNTGTITSVKTTAGAHTTINVSSGAANFNVPTKTSHLTNDSGFITTSDIPEGAVASTSTPLMDGTAAVGTELAFARGDHRHPKDTSKQDVIQDLADIRSGAALGATALQSFTETDPIFSASVAAGITSSDITNWNGKTNNTGTITGVSVNGTSVATSGVANITSVPASILSGAIKNGVTATTQSAGDNSTKVATTAYVDTAIDNLPEPMVFKGSLGTGGTITSLPTAAAANTGFTYKVITAGTYASQAAKVGDTFISDGSKWNLIPSGDEPSGTVTSITISATSPIAIDSSAAITTSGSRTISHVTSGVTAGTYKSVIVNATGHVTGGTNPTTLSGYGITDAKIANGVITLGSNSITPLTSFTESDPVFAASAASGITSSDISNWNGKTSNVGTITGVTGSDGLTGSGTSGSVTIKHAAPSTSPAKSTSAVYPITIDKYGHITAAGTAVTIPSAVTESTVSGWGFTKNTGTITGITMNGASKGTSGVVNLGTVITAHQDISGKADKATTLSGYGITDAKIESGVITLGSNTITPLTQHQDITGKQDSLVSGTNIKTINGETLLGSGDLELATNIPEINHGTSDTTFQLTPNVMHIWGEVTSLTLTLPTDTNEVLDEFMFTFTSGSTPTTLSLPLSIKWMHNLSIEANKTYQVSIVNGLAGYMTENMNTATIPIESISVNNVAQTITNNNVNITVPTKVSDLTNDSGYLTQHQDISGKANISDFSIVESTGEVALSLPNNIDLNLITDISGKADKTATVSTVTYDTTNHKITKTINGVTTDVVTAAQIVADGGSSSVTFRVW